MIEAVAAVVVLNGDTVPPEEIIDHTRGLIAPYKVPKTVTFVDELPRNQSGKLLKRQLRAAPIRN